MLLQNLCIAIKTSLICTNSERTVESAHGIKHDPLYSQFNAIYLSDITDRKAIAEPTKHEEIIENARHAKQGPVDLITASILFRKLPVR